MSKIAVEKNINTTMLILQCVGIIAVVLGHAEIGGGMVPNILNFIFPYYAWHMPFFIFISGYFFNRELGAGKYIIKKTKTLLIPAMLTNVACGIFSALIKYWDIAEYGQDITLRAIFVTPFTTGYQFYINVSLWFIFALFVIEVIACLMDRMAKGKADLIFLCLTFIVSICCCQCAYYNHEATRGEFLNAGLRFGFLTFFFWLGVCYRRFFEQRFKRFLNEKTSVIIFLAATLLHICTQYNYSYNTRNMNLISISVPNGFWVAVVAPIAVIIFFLGLAYALEGKLRNNRVLMALGRNTRYVVYYHQLCFCLCSYAVASMMNYGLMPNQTGFELESMRKSAYYCGGTYLALFISIISIVLPIFICTRINKLKNRWCHVLCYMVLLLLVILYLYLVKRAIY